MTMLHFHYKLASTKGIVHRYNLWVLSQVDEKLADIFSYFLNRVMNP